MALVSPDTQCRAPWAHLRGRASTVAVRADSKQYGPSYAETAVTRGMSVVLVHCM